MSYPLCLQSRFIFYRRKNENFILSTTWRIMLLINTFYLMQYWTGSRDFQIAYWHLSPQFGNRKTRLHKLYFILSNAIFSNNTFTRLSPRHASCGLSLILSTSVINSCFWTSPNFLTFAIRLICNWAASGEICGSRPLAEAKSISDGTSTFLSSWLNAINLFFR